jgi:acyl-CoA synthetase (AMP-forming)/AMP-acid ligase II
VGISNNKVYILEMPKEFSGSKSVPFKTVGQLVGEGAQLPELEKLKWEKGQGKRQTAFLCYSSGTSGLPVRLSCSKNYGGQNLTDNIQKGVMISHQNVISNVLQFNLFEKHVREKRPKGQTSEVVLGLLPLSHIYGLVVIAHVSAYRGDEVIILPKFEMPSFLNAIQRFKIAGLYLVCLEAGEKVCLLTRPGTSNHHPISQEPESVLTI